MCAMARTRLLQHKRLGTTRLSVDVECALEVQMVEEVHGRRVSEMGPEEI